MSTRCQIGFYDSADVKLNSPDVVIYRHADGYPGDYDNPEDFGVLQGLVPFCTDFNKRWGLKDTSYASARCLVALIKHHGLEGEVTSYGIDGAKELHGDIEYYYRVDPKEVIVYETGSDVSFDTMEEIQRVSVI